MFTAATLHDYETRGRNELRHPLVRTSLAQKCIRNHMPNFINNSPVEITGKIDTHSLEGVSQYAKKYYISLYNEFCYVENCYVCSRD